MRVVSRTATGINQTDFSVCVSSGPVLFSLNFIYITLINSDTPLTLDALFCCDPHTPDELNHPRTTRESPFYLFYD